jgi:peptidoglycan/LPS O-acetylase OafA/YrhL
VQSAPDAARFNAYVLIQNHAFAFLLGGLLAKLRPYVIARVALPVACAVLSMAALFWVASRPLVIDHFDVVLGMRRAGYVAAAAACVGLAAWTQTASARVGAWLERFGELSYPVYLLHPLAWVACRGWLPDRTPPLAAVGVALGLTLALAVLATHCYERPIRQLFTRVSFGRRA